METGQLLKGVIITSDEYDRLWCGELTEADFSTSRPNPYRVGKIALGVEKYLKYKRKQLLQSLDIEGDN